MAYIWGIAGGRATGHTTPGGFYVPPEGLNIFNIESLVGMNTAGLIYVWGNENQTNQSFVLYTYNLSSYYNPYTRYVTLTEVARNHINNGYGHVDLYFSNYAGDRTNSSKYASSQDAAISDVYIRNRVGQACSASYLVVRCPN